MHVIYHSFFPVGWLGFWGYWMIMARQVRKTRKAEPQSTRFARVAFNCFVFALVALPQFGHGILGRQLLGADRIRFWAGAALLMFGLGLSVWARVHLGSYWSGTITLKEGHKVIRTGPYRLVRHPIYAGLWLGFLGTAVALGEVRGFVALVLLVTVQFFKSQREERWLEQDLGEEYRRYRKEVPAFVPFLKHP